MEDEYIDDTLEDLEDLDQYRLKIDLNEFTVDNPDLPDPILKKPLEFSWARAVSEEEKCQARGEEVAPYSGPVEVVWYDELEGERNASSNKKQKIPEEAEVPDESVENGKEVKDSEGPEKEVGNEDTENACKSEKAFEDDHSVKEKNESGNVPTADADVDKSEELKENTESGKEEVSTEPVEDVKCSDEPHEEVSLSPETDAKNYESPKKESVEMKIEVIPSNSDPNSAENLVSDSIKLESDPPCSDT